MIAKIGDHTSLTPSRIETEYSSLSVTKFLERIPDPSRHLVWPSNKDKNLEKLLYFLQNIDRASIRNVEI